MSSEWNGGCKRVACVIQWGIRGTGSTGIKGTQSRPTRPGGEVSPSVWTVCQASCWAACHCGRCLMGDDDRRGRTLFCLYGAFWGPKTCHNTSLTVMPANALPMAKMSPGHSPLQKAAERGSVGVSTAAPHHFKSLCPTWADTLLVRRARPQSQCAERRTTRGEEFWMSWPLQNTGRTQPHCSR